MNKNSIISTAFWIITFFLIFVPLIYLYQDSVSQIIHIDGSPSIGLIIQLPAFLFLIFLLIGLWIICIIKIFLGRIWKEPFFYKFGYITTGCFIICMAGIKIYYSIPQFSAEVLVKEIPGKNGCYSFYSIESGDDKICLKETVYPYGENNLFAKEYYLGKKGTYIRRDTIYRKNQSEWSFEKYKNGVSGEIIIP